MASPLKYFPEAKQREMAAQVWALAATKTNFFSDICSVNQYRFTTPDARQVLHAKDWLTYYRQDGAQEDNDSVNRQLNKAPGYYSGECIADVEHFFVAAFMEVAIGPALTQVGVVGWETFDIVLKRPVLKALEADALGGNVAAAFFNGFHGGLGAWFKSIKWNYGQAIRAQSGIAFGSELLEGQSAIPIIGDGAIAIAKATAALRDAVNFVQKTLATPPPRMPTFDTSPVGICPISPGPGSTDKEFKLDFNDPKRRSLSAVSMAVYQTFDLWPLIWWHNPSLAANPNKLRGLTHVRYRELSSYSSSEIAKAKAAAPSWKSFAL